MESAENKIDQEPQCEDSTGACDQAGPDLIIITGMSGAGRTEAMHTFEDLGYFCIDNLPPSLIMNLVSLANIPGQGEQMRKLAVVCDARNRAYFQQLAKELGHLKEAGVSYRVMFLDAADDALLARYKASRRRHPMCVDSKMTLSQGIQKERELLADLLDMADTVIDTTGKKPIQLRQELRERFSKESAQSGLNVVVYSFGFKHGAALDADIVIDVRFLPNPFYEPDLRRLTGLDVPVRDYVMKRSETKEFLRCWESLLACVMPGYVSEGKQQLAIAVGCTGGQHRSVCLAEVTGSYLKQLGYHVDVTHRDLPLAETLEPVKPEVEAR